MREYREEVVRTTPPGDAVIEERVVETPIVDPMVTPAVVVEQPPRQVVRRWWRRAPVPTDVVSTEYYTAPAYAYDPTLAQFLRVMWFLVGLLEGLFALRFLLALMAANPNNAFASLIYGLTGPFVAPFRTLFATPTAGGSVVELYTLTAMVVYFLAWWAFVKLIGVVTNRPVDL
jgi:hypothetical protein